MRNDKVKLAVADWLNRDPQFEPVIARLGPRTFCLAFVVPVKGFCLGATDPTRVTLLGVRLSWGDVHEALARVQAIRRAVDGLSSEVSNG